MIVFYLKIAALFSPFHEDAAEFWLTHFDDTQHDLLQVTGSTDSV